MIVELENKSHRIAQMSDHLIDDDRFFNLDDPSVFLDWGYDNMSNFYDASTEDGQWVEDFDIEGLFNHWWSFVKDRKEDN